MENPISTEGIRSPSAGSHARPSAAIASRFAAIAAATDTPFRVVLSNGAVIQGHDGTPAFTVTFHTRAAERSVLLFGYVGLLESYFDGSVDIDGSLALAFRAGFDGGFDQVQTRLVRLRSQWFEHRYSNRSLTQAKANARFHYGLGQEFYRPWLDHPSMMYTCAYWKEGTNTLEEAQRNKMDHVCRKVQLQAGETFVDVGSGWGGLLFHAWEHYQALGTGINATTEQVKETNTEIERRGLAGRIRVIECDFRRIPGQYDKLLSIGTLEHAGRDQLPQVVRAHAGALRPGGLGVIHFIGHVGERDTELYIRKYIFPGGWIPSLSTALDWMERCGLEILDVENLRRHYALTLDVWAERFDRSWEAIQSLDPKRFNERFRRIWRTYLWSCAEAFRTKTPQLNLFQVTVSKNSVGRDYPMSRSFLYGK
ncbi:MAG TPA: cyclopropane-fatty-acyl-phospholipid synthase family protein [Steroidobacteraceae bacterium]|nr:cyclopropane-fatty-acyl-phospholipid synthase family protein [Steroidobacteraceae bacterium]